MFRDVDAVAQHVDVHLEQLDALGAVVLGDPLAAAGGGLADERLAGLEQQDPELLGDAAALAAEPQAPAGRGSRLPVASLTTSFFAFAMRSSIDVGGLGDARLRVYMSVL